VEHPGKYVIGNGRGIAPDNYQINEHRTPKRLCGQGHRLSKKEERRAFPTNSWEGNRSYERNLKGVDELMDNIGATDAKGYQGFFIWERVGGGLALYKD